MVSAGTGRTPSGWGFWVRSCGVWGSCCVGGIGGGCMSGGMPAHGSRDLHAMLMVYSSLSMMSSMSCGVFMKPPAPFPDWEWCMASCVIVVFG